MSFLRQQKQLNSLPAVMNVVSMTTKHNSVHVPSEEVTNTSATTPGSGKKRVSTPIKIDSIQCELLAVEKEDCQQKRKD
ncbi:Hypothetical predicted protein [Mytilus galloprovincialis]|uniref:Uncharacterized protein n=1 Tax=Mytilus galloprovincialis TaxID=29158 RepID=A0A8B6HBG0_MYTGA|nr:Hypothetical predicted protein [Mytilus galloprovincialis]